MSKRLIYEEDAIDALMEILDRPNHAEFLYTDEICKALEDLPSAQPQWIPVTERLPEYGTEVVTINKDDEYEINHVIDEEDGEWFFDGAVAWMPLPEPYKGEQG